MAHKKIISFPHMGNYHIPVSFLAAHILDMIPQAPPPITKKTLELGSKYSPDSVCVPFKYCLGSFIEALDKGATVLAQAVGGCRFSYYGEVQNQILKDLGYTFTFIEIAPAKKVTPVTIYRAFKKINPKLNIFRFTYYFYLTYYMLELLDDLEDYMRQNMGFEQESGAFDKVHHDFLIALATIKNIKDLKKVTKKYWTLFKDIKLDKPQDPLKIGIIGELYTEMEPFCNYQLEKELIKRKVVVKRITTLSYLLFKKPKNVQVAIDKAKAYLKYHIGADGTDNIAKAITLIDAGFDGLIHSKPFACTPEINAMPILQKLSKDYNIPILFLSFDAQTSEGGILTRVEAFYDMLKMRKDKK